MKQTVNMIAAPTATQPGGYIAKAYADRTTATVAQVELNVETQDKGWKVTLSWACPAPVNNIAGETDKFLDACALLVPTTEDGQWITMGEPGKAVEGVLWKADRERPWRMRAEGLGTMQRAQAPDGWQVGGVHADGRWTVSFQIDEWSALAQFKKLAFVVWLGSQQDRGGLKSVSPGWLDIA